MAKNIKDTTLNDVESAVADKVEDIKEDATEAREKVESKVNGLNPTQKVLLLTGGVLLVSGVVQAIFNRFRKPVVVEGDVILEPAEGANVEVNVEN